MRYSRGEDGPAIDTTPASPDSPLSRFRDLLVSSFRLGLTSFGGPIAHLAYFRDEYVVRQRWLDDQRYADIVALAQFLPGPASSQVGMAVGWLRLGWWGALTAWVGFTAPSALLMVLAAWGGAHLPPDLLPWFRGLAVVAVAVVAQAVMTMTATFLTDRKTTAAGLGMVVFLALAPPGTSPVLFLAAAGVVGWWAFRPAGVPAPRKAMSVGAAVVPLILFVVLLAGLPWLRSGDWGPLAALADGFYRAGALVFGGGHVVLPLLETELRTLPGIGPQDLLLGYGWAQALPGPLFSVSAYWGFLVGGPGGALVATVALFLPGLLLILGVLPVWEAVRTAPALRGALAAVNAAVVGLLGYALYTPLGTHALHGAGDLALAVVLFALAVRWKVPAWGIVLVGLAGGAGLQALGA